MQLNEPSSKYLVRSDYRQTSIGEIPSDWNAKTLGSLVTSIVRGASPRPIDDPIWFQESSRVGWVRISDITSAGRYLTHTAQRLSGKGIKRSRFIPSGSLVMSICATVGRPVETMIDTCIHDGFVVFEKPKIDQSFLYHVLKDLEPKWGEKGQTSSQMNLNTTLIKGARVPVPPSLTEQASIASVLTHGDALIESLDHLLVKKRQIMQGAMQELLIGRRRLPGFADQWISKSIGDLLSIRHGRDQKKVSNDSGHYPIMASGGQIGWATTFLYDKPSVLIGRKGTIDEPRYMETPFWTVDTLFYSEIHEPNCAKFLYYRFCLVDWMRYSEASGVPSLSAKVIEAVVIEQPPAAEQVAIAKVLSDMDTEITALEARVTKARQLKQGMAQALLSGRIRLT